jgi:lactoylglutathione lyase
VACEDRPVFRSLHPILATHDVERSLGFYRDGLGARVTYRFPDDGEAVYVGLELGASHLGIGLDTEPLAPADGRRVTLWVYADDCDAAVARLRGMDVTVLEEPSDEPWGERVARVLDPDGNQVLIGAPPP